MGAFSAYEFLNFIVPGFWLLIVGFNGLLSEQELTENQVIEAILMTALAFLIGQLCAGLGSFTQRSLEHDDEADPSRTVPLLWSHIEAPATDSLAKQPDVLRTSARLLELLGRDAHAKMLSQQENFHRNMTSAIALSMIAHVVTRLAGENELGWYVLPILPALGAFFYWRFSHFRKRYKEHISVTTSLLPIAEKFGDLA